MSNERAAETFSSTTETPSLTNGGKAVGEHGSSTVSGLREPLVLQYPEVGGVPAEAPRSERSLRTIPGTARPACRTLTARTLCLRRAPSALQTSSVKGSHVVPPDDHRAAMAENSAATLIPPPPRQQQPRKQLGKARTRALGHAVPPAALISPPTCPLPWTEVAGTPTRDETINKNRISSALMAQEASSSDPPTGCIFHPIGVGVG
uniref:Uncharacterized protein n=1 Tax=Anopheles coluzzii TaxID=1518534 RepID=A0A8W7P0Z7_ANOCL